MRNLTARNLGRPFISLNDKRKVLQDLIFVTDTGYGNFLLSSDMKKTAGDICKTPVYKAV